VSTGSHKACSCGEQYTTAEWLLLPLLGPMEDGDGGWLVLRNCAQCDSTIALDARDDLAVLDTLIRDLEGQKRPVEWAAGDLSGAEPDVIAAQVKPSQNAALLSKYLSDWHKLTRYVLTHCRIHGDALILACDECVNATAHRDPKIRTLASRARASARASVSP
jgi:hypothetical protein